MSTPLHDLLDAAVARMTTDVPSETLRSQLLDPGAAVVDGSGAVVHCSSLRHLATLGEAARRIRSHRRVRMEPGDVVVLNDPFSGGTRVHDVYGARSIGVVAGEPWLLAARMTVVDLGGDVFGAYNPRASEIWAEGARFTPVVLYSNGRWVRDSATCVTLNSRTPRLLEAQLRSLVAALEDAARGLQKIVAAPEFSERVNGWAPQEALKVPGLVDAAGEAEVPIEASVVVRVELRSTTDLVAVDFRKSDPQTPTYCNATRSTTISIVLEALLPPLDPETLISDRLFAHLDVFTTPGSIVDAAYPAPTGCGPIIGAQVIRVALGRALRAQAQPSVTNSFLSPDGQLDEALAARLTEDEARCADASPLWS
jgi:N-methylhydantoinase B